MTTPRNVAASVRARLLKLAQSRGDDFQLVLLRYANERLLARLAASPYAGEFVLKGATLFTVWMAVPHRATRDLDLLGFGPPTPDRVRQVIEDLIAQEIDDGVAFDASSITAAPIREDQEYGGVRVVLAASIAGAKVRLQVDVGFGDVVTPEATMIELPALLDFPAPRLRGYPRETVVAEKLNAMVELRLDNSRMKDFYDLDVLARSFAFDGPLLVQAVRATFDRRGTPLPDDRPVALTSEFGDNPDKIRQWIAFGRKAGIKEVGTLAETLQRLSVFAWPLFEAAKRSEEWRASWQPGGPWTAAHGT
jgi:predicted nucleotidyltransferase component of viral defense system